jgi:hypothetical protein
LGENRWYTLDENIHKSTNGSVRECITENHPISDGIEKIRTKFYTQKDEYSEGKMMSDESCSYTIYFMEEIVNNKVYQNCTSELKNKYASLTKFPKVQDGWSIVYANDGILLCGMRHVFVENGKITLYKNGHDENLPISSGGIINNCKSTISVPYKDLPIMIFDIYFL